MSRKHTPEEAAAAKERIKAYGRAYRDTPEARAKEAARRASPEYKKAQAAYYAVRNALPEIKAAKAAHDATRYVTAEAKALKASRVVAYNTRPEVKAARVAREASPEVKAAQAAYRARPEVKAARAISAAAYRARPEVKAAKVVSRAAYNARPDVKAAKAARSAAYNTRPEVKVATAAYEKARKSTPLGNLMARLRQRTGKAFTRGGFKKGSKTEEILGCKWEFLKAHIEAQFTEGMSWENRRLWHIDHIIPLSSAKDEGTLLKLCHYSNLQPLWWRDNISKGAKMPIAA